jgi:hypothetical protein
MVQVVTVTEPHSRADCAASSSAVYEVNVGQPLLYTQTLRIKKTVGSQRE